MLLAKPVKEPPPVFAMGTACEAGFAPPATAVNSIGEGAVSEIDGAV